MCFEAYVKAFQYKVLNSILYFNTKLHKIGYITDDKRTFVSLNQKPYCTFFLTAHAQSFSGKTLNFTFTLCQKNLFTTMMLRGPQINNMPDKSLVIIIIINIQGHIMKSLWQ